MRLPALAALALGMAAAAVAQTATPWEYQGKRGELNWSKLDPAYRVCSKGKEQSPIDIRNAHLNKALQPIEFHYISGSVRLENDGHTIIAHVGPGSYMVAGGVRYDLIEYHFHHPSETAVKGKLTEMEVQLLHKSADGKMAILVVQATREPRCSQCRAGRALAASAQDRRGGRQGDRDGERRRPAARRPRLLDLHGFAGHAALH